MGVFRDSTLPQGFGGQLNIWLLAGKYIYSKLGIRVNGLYMLFDEYIFPCLFCWVNCLGS